ncbi:MAG: hypothetical protein V9E81_12955 [Marmoricola sp.]
MRLEIWFHNRGNAETNPSAISKTPEMIDHTCAGMSIKMVDALSSNVKPKTDAPKPAAIHHTRR